MREILFLWADEAHVQHQTDAPVVALKFGERGFYPIHTRATPDVLNGGPLPREVRMAALVGSVVGWDAPGAAAAVQYLQQYAARVWADARQEEHEAAQTQPQEYRL